MAIDTYSVSLRLRYQATGNNLNVWGAIANSAVFQLIEDALSGATVLSGASAITLSSLNGSTDQARCMALVYSGVGTTVTIPAVKKLYVVDNTAGTGPLIITTGSGNVASVEAGCRIFVNCPDGANCNLVRDTGLLALSKTYTDNKVLQASSGQLPGPSVNGQVIFGSGGMPIWHQLVTADVANLDAEILEGKRRATALAFAL